MKKITLILLLFAVLVSCEDNYTIENFRVSYQTLRQQHPDAWIIQDPIMYSKFWVGGDDYITFYEFETNKPTKIKTMETIDGIRTDDDGTVPKNSTAYDGGVFVDGLPKTE